MPDLFISYSHGDTPKALLLAYLLKTHGRSVWLASEDLTGHSATKSWGQIESAIKQARGIIFLVTQGSVAGEWLRREYMAALEATWSDPEKLLIPVVEGSAELPPFLKYTQSVRVTNRSGWSNAAASIARVLDGKAKRTIMSRKAEAIRTKRLSAIEHEAQLLKLIEGQRLLSEAVNYLGTENPQENRAAIKLLSKRLLKRWEPFEGPVKGRSQPSKKAD